MAKKNTVKNSDLCATGLSDPVERKIMATAMKQGEEQVNILRESKNKNQEDSEK